MSAAVVAARGPGRPWKSISRRREAGLLAALDHLGEAATIMAVSRHLGWPRSTVHFHWAKLHRRGECRAVATDRGVPRAKDAAILAAVRAMGDEATVRGVAARTRVARPTVGAAWRRLAAAGRCPPPPGRGGGKRRAAMRPAEARNALAEANLGAAYAEARAYLRRRPADDPDEVESSALWLSLRAAELWDESRGVKFHTYMRRCVARALPRSVRGRRPPITLVASDLDGADRVRGGFLAGIADGRMSRPDPDRHLVTEALGILSGREAAVIRLRYGLDGGSPAPLRAAAEAAGLSEEGARKAQERALAKMRRHLAAGGGS
jgi:RNA polymerase sporulation-specific sigma factor